MDPIVSLQNSGGSQGLPGVFISELSVLANASAGTARISAMGCLSLFLASPLASFLGLPAT